MAGSSLCVGGSAVGEEFPTRRIEAADDVVRVLEPLYEAAAEAVKIDGDPDVSESAIAWNEGYYKGITDALARVQAGVVISVP